MSFFVDNVAPPDGYVCKLCFIPGHFMKHCGLYKERLGGMGERPRYDPHAVPPDNYVCKLCFIPGHFMKNCNLYKERAPGILSTATPGQLEELAKAVVAAAQAQSNGDVASSAMAALAAYRAQHPELSRAVDVARGVITDDLDSSSQDTRRDSKDSVKSETSPVDKPPRLEKVEKLSEKGSSASIGEESPAVNAATMSALATLESLQAQQQAFWAQNNTQDSGLSQLAGALQHLSMRGSPTPYRKHYSSAPPDGYVCKICGTPGHWIQQCPLRHTHPPPHLRMSPVSPNMNGFNMSPSMTHSHSPPLTYPLVSPTNSMHSIGTSALGMTTSVLSPTHVSTNGYSRDYFSGNARSAFESVSPFDSKVMDREEAERIVNSLLM